MEAAAAIGRAPLAIGLATAGLPPGLPPNPRKVTVKGFLGAAGMPARLGARLSAARSRGRLALLPTVVVCCRVTVAARLHSRANLTFALFAAALDLTALTHWLLTRSDASTDDAAGHRVIAAKERSI